MRKIIAFLGILVSVNDCRAENEIAFPSFDSNKTCNEAFAGSGTYPSRVLLRICLRSEQRSYNMSRTAWEYLSSSSGRYCGDHLDSAVRNARKIHKFRYTGLADPYTELWLCIERKIKDEAARERPKAVEKW